MNLIERYLQAVGWWLPERQKLDIIAELSADLHAQIEEKESELGRKLNDAEVEAILKRCGRPRVVASRYLPPRALIGPTLFPIYWKVLRWVATLTLLPWLGIWTVLAIVDPRFRTSIPALTPLQIWASISWVAIVMFGVITGVFAAIERFGGSMDTGGEWSPRRLPAVRDAWRLPRARSAFDLAGHIVLLAWWFIVPRESLGLPGAGSGWRAGAMLADIHGRWFGWVLLLLLANIALSIANLARPYWTRTRRAARMAIFAGGAALCLSLVAQHTATFYSGIALIRVFKGSQPSGTVGDFTAAVIDVMLFLSLLGTGIGVSVAAIVEAFYIVLGKSRGTA